MKTRLYATPAVKGLSTRAYGQLMLINWNFDVCWIQLFLFVSGLLNPSDGVAKLRHMEASTGIWTMRVQLVIDDKDVIIYDKATLVSADKI